MSNSIFSNHSFKLAHSAVKSRPAQVSQKNRNSIKISSNCILFHPVFSTAGISLYFHFIYFPNLGISIREKIFSDEIDVRHFILTEWKYWWWTVMEFGITSSSYLPYLTFTKTAVIRKMSEIVSKRSNAEQDSRDRTFTNQCDVILCPEVQSSKWEKF